MTEHIRYARAPITEALIDLRTKAPPALTLDVLARICDGEQTAYPTRNDRVDFESQIVGGAQVSAAARQTLVGYALTNANGKHVCQITLTGFTFSRLHPYESWEPFQQEAHRLWTKYRDVARPTEIQRLAVRYINRLDVPLPGRVEDYLRTYPQLADELPQSLGDYFMRLVVSAPDLPGTIAITEARVPPPAEGIASLILDIDVFRSDEVPQDEEGIWAFFQALRRCKNDVFNACITDKTKDLIR